MRQKKRITTLILENKPLFLIIAIGLFFIELEIFALVAVKSGEKAFIQIMDNQDNIIYRISGKRIGEYEKAYIEKTFGPLDQFHVKLVTEYRPFPFRAWFTAAIGLPVGFILLLGFVVRAFFSFFSGEEKPTDQQTLPDMQYETRFEKIIGMVSRLNIFAIGFLIVLAMFSYWVIPNMIMYLGAISIQTILTYKWFFISLALILLAVFLWIVYLRYLLAKKAIDAQTELDKYRLQLNYNGKNDQALLEHKDDSVLLVDWQEKKENDQNDNP